MNESTEAQPALRVAPPIIPVLDVMIGQVVLARGGSRDNYAPIHTKLTTNSEPLAVARAMFGQTGCDCLYLADLDCYEGARPNRRIYEDLIRTGFSLWVDADWLTQDRLDILPEDFATAPMQPIISTEAMSSTDQFVRLGELVKRGFTPIFSIDSKGNSILSKSDEVAALSPIELAKRAADQGVKEIIYLNLESVGTDRGVVETAQTIRQLHSELPGINLISGGGIRSVDDAADLIRAGCQHVLVASAIHDCKLRPDDVTMLNESR